MKRTKWLLVFLQAFWCEYLEIQTCCHVDLYNRIKGKNENQKAVCFEVQHLTVTSSEKKRRKNSKSVSLWWESDSASSPLFIVTSLADTGKLKDCSCAFTKASSLVWSQTIPSAPPEKGRGGKTPLGSEIALSPKKESLLR